MGAMFRQTLKGRRAEYLLHKERTRTLVYARLRHFNQLYGCTFGAVAIRNQKTRWGSCSRAGNLNFHYKLAFLPLPLADYVIVHELCHLREFNHSPQFWRLVERAVPDYRALRKALQSFL